MHRASSRSVSAKTSSRTAANIGSARAQAHASGRIDRSLQVDLVQPRHERAGSSRVTTVLLSRGRPSRDSKHLSRSERARSLASEELTALFVGEEGYLTPEPPAFSGLGLGGERHAQTARARRRAASVVEYR
jgi:hypothetical protein